LAKKISCPKCKHCFDLVDFGIEESGKKRKSNPSTSRTPSKSTANNRTNKKKKTV